MRLNYLIAVIFILVISFYAGLYVFHNDYQKNIAAIEERDKSISSRVDRLDIEASDFRNISAQLGVNISDCSDRLANLNGRVSSLDESVSFISSDLDSLKQKVEKLESLIAEKLGLPNPRLIGYWPFDEGQGLTVMEKNGNGYAGAIEGAFDFSGLWGDGIKGKALYFDGKTYVRVKNSFDGRLNLGFRDFTLSCWIKTAAFSDGADWDRQDVVAFGDPYNSGIAISVFHNRPAGFVGNTGRAGYSENAKIINDGQWHEIILKRKSGAVYLYADGSLQHKYFFGGDVTVSSDLFIGKHGVKEESYFKGAIDEVKLFNYALSGAEIAGNYNSMVSRVGLNRPLVKPEAEEITGGYYPTIKLTVNPGRGFKTSMGMRSGVIKSQAVSMPAPQGEYSDKTGSYQVTTCGVLHAPLRSCQDPAYDNEDSKVSAVIGDYRSIKTAVMTFYADTGYWPESVDNGSGLVSKANTPGWDGPYLEKWPASAPWGGKYGYFKDSQGCYLTIPNVSDNSSFNIDSKIDGGDGALEGSVRWAKGIAGGNTVTLIIAINIGQ